MLVSYEIDGILTITYRSQKGVHQPVHLVRWSEVATLQHSHRQIWNCNQMLSQHFFESLTEHIIVLQASNLRDYPELLKGFVVEFVYKGDMGVGNHNVGQLLDVPQTMGETI